MHNNDEILTPRQAREVLKISRNTMYMLLQSGALKARKVGDQWRVRRSEIDRYMAEEEAA